MQPKQWLKYLMIYGIASLCIILLFNYFVDPFQHYRKATIYTFNYSGNQRYLNPGLAKNYDFNSIIIGTSMTENFTLDNVIDNWNNRNQQFHHGKNFWILSELKNNFDNNLYRFITENKNTKFILFFPPYSILTYKDWEEKGSLDIILKFKQYIYKKLIALDNVNLYDFQIAQNITHNLNHYKDITHYSQTINFWIVDQIYSHDFLITPENQEHNLRSFIDQIREYTITF